MNDGTGWNPSDPNSMQNQGEVRNAVYNLNLGRDAPKVGGAILSKAFDYSNPGVLNNSFYSFGAKHTNIRTHLDNKKGFLSSSSTDLSNYNGPNKT
jgi:hypothetical protein